MNEDPNDLNPTDAPGVDLQTPEPFAVNEDSVGDEAFVMAGDIPLEPAPLAHAGEDEILTGGSVGEFAADNAGPDANPFDDLNVPDVADPEGLPDAIDPKPEDNNGPADNWMDLPVGGDPVSLPPEPEPDPHASVDAYADAPPMTYERAMREIDRMGNDTPFDDLHAPPQGITFEQASAELDRMERGLHPGNVAPDVLTPELDSPTGLPNPFSNPELFPDSPGNSGAPAIPAPVVEGTDPYADAPPMTYEQAMREIDRLSGADTPPVAEVITPIPNGETPAVNPDDPGNPVTPAVEPPADPAPETPVNEPSSPAVVPPMADPDPSPAPDEPPANGTDPVTVHAPAAPTGEILPDDPAPTPATDDPPDTPDAPAPPDPTAYVDHLHELTGDQVLDEAFHQDQPELKQAAYEELKARLHAADGPAPTPEPPAAPDDPAPPAPDEPPEPAILSHDDLDNLLTARAGETAEDLSWQTSVVDLLKLFGKDSSHEARERYAVDLGFPEDNLGQTSSSDLNQWLHGQLMTSLAQNGGNLPSNLA